MTANQIKYDGFETGRKPALTRFQFNYLIFATTNLNGILQNSRILI
ncbi:MAG: hypothetical protein IPM91_22110 [Bacteroidetes bacterium]|nr:hypothetical protein [Bacteroidota bacterium]